MGIKYKLEVGLGVRSYPILIGENLLGEVAKFLPQKRTLIITDANVAKAHLKKLEASLKKSGVKFETKILPAGEKAKSCKYFAELLEWILAKKPERKTTIIAFGGGVIGDLVGFAASVTLRGINFIQLPTTLLAQVDSSVGGKTAINSRYGKNLIGSFHQPKAVIIDTKLLATLPRREFLSGYAEVVKYGLINNPVFFKWLDNTNLKTHIAQAIYQSCKSKAAIVSSDEKEAGVRALLNLGHTFGHALEAEAGFSDKLLHGEAVALGMLMAFRFSEKLGLCKPEETQKVLQHFKKIKLPTSPKRYLKKWDVRKLISHMKSDKKVKDRKMVFILTRGIGKAFIHENVSEKDLKKFLASYDK